MSMYYLYDRPISIDNEFLTEYDNYLSTTHALSILCNNRWPVLT